MPNNDDIMTREIKQINDVYVNESKEEAKSRREENNNNELFISADSNTLTSDFHQYYNNNTQNEQNVLDDDKEKANNVAMRQQRQEREPRRYRFVVEQKYMTPEHTMTESSPTLENKLSSTSNTNKNKNKMESLFASSAPPNTISRSSPTNSVSATAPKGIKPLSASDKATHKSHGRTNSNTNNTNNTNNKTDTDEWEVVAITNDNVCAIPITGPVSRLRCRVKCCRVYSERSFAQELSSPQEQEEEEHPFSDYSEEVGVIPGTPPEAVHDLHITNVCTNKMTISWNSASINKTGRRRNTGKHLTTTNNNMSYRIYLSEANSPAILVDILTRKDLEEEMETLQEVEEKEKQLNSKKAHPLEHLQEEKHQTHMPKIKRRNVHKPISTLQHIIYNLQQNTQYTLQVVAENEHGMSYNNPTVEFITQSNVLPPIKDATHGHGLQQNQHTNNNNKEDEDYYNGSNAEIVIPTATTLPEANGSKRSKQSKSGKRSNSKKQQEHKKEEKRSHSLRDAANKLKTTNKQKSKTFAADREDVITADQVETSNASPLTSQSPINISVEDSYERDRLVIESNEFDCTSDNVLMLLPERSSSTEITTSHRAVNASNTETSENVNYTSESTDMISLPMISRTMEIVTNEEQEEREKV